MDLECYMCIAIDIDGYKHNAKGFYEKFTYPKSKNKERMITPNGAHTNLVETFPLSSHSLSMKSFKRRSNHLMIVWILLAAKNYNTFKKLIKQTF